MRLVMVTTALVTKIRVFLVDDSVLVRRIVSDMLASDPRIEMMATAPNGRIALDKLEQGHPDVVLLDVEMPEMDGLETLRRIRERWRELPVIMFSALTERAGQATLDALSLGASDYVTKPTSTGGVMISKEDVRTTLIAKIVAVCGRERVTRPAPSIAPVADAPPGATGVELVVLGASTGGPNLVADLLAGMPASFPVPMVIVQHMPPLFTRLFSERLDSISPLDVKEASDGEAISAGMVRIAPGDFHAVVERQGTRLVVRTNQGTPECSCRPSVDTLFRSAAAATGAGTLAVVLTGMGYDGLVGAGLVRASGGQVLVQDEASSVVWSMPGSIARAGLADKIVPIAELGVELDRRVAPRRGGARSNG